MLNDTAARKSLALELLARGHTIRQICFLIPIKRHSIRYWKTSDDRFRAKWNEVMDQLGRFIENGGDK